VFASQEEDKEEKAFEVLLHYNRQHLWFSASEGLEVPAHLCPHTSAGAGHPFTLCPYGIPLSSARNFG